MPSREDPRISVRVRQADHHALLKAAVRQNVKPSAIVQALIWKAPQMDLTLLLSEWRATMHGARASASPPGSMAAGAASSPAPATRALGSIVEERLGTQSLALRAIRMGQVKVRNVPIYEPSTVVDPSEVTM